MPSLIRWRRRSCSPRPRICTLTKFANQADAVRAYEKVLEVDPNQPAAITYLREMYEKRRDWRS